MFLHAWHLFFLFFFKIIHAADTCQCEKTYFVDYDCHGEICTSKDGACSTLSNALGKMDSGDTVIIIYHRAYTPHTLGATITQPVTITGLYSHDYNTQSRPILRQTANCFSIQLTYPLGPYSEKNNLVSLDTLDVLVSNGCFLSVLNYVSVELTSIHFYRAEDDTTITSDLISLSSGNLEVDECCVYGLSLQGASIIAISSGANSFYLTDCHFHDVHSSSAGSIVRGTVSAKHSVSISNNEFISCHSQTTGGAVSLTLESETYLTFYGNDFTYCTAGTDGGAVALDVQEKCSISFRTDWNPDSDPVRFSNCRAGRNGGGLYLSLHNHACLEAEALRVSDCSAKENGHFVYVETNHDSHVERKTTLWYSFVTENTFEYAFLPNTFVVHKTGTGSGLYQMVDIGNYASVVNKDTTIAEDDECKIFTQRCSSIQAAYEVLTECPYYQDPADAKYNYRITLLKGNHDSEEQTFSTPILLTGETETPSETHLIVANAKQLMCQDYTLIRNIQVDVVTSGQAALSATAISSTKALCLSNCVFKASEETATKLTYSLLYIEDTLLVYKCSFSTLSFDGLSLFESSYSSSAGSTNLYAVGSSFTSITQQGADAHGSVFNLAAGQNLQLTGCTFTSCTTTGSGGAVYSDAAYLSIGATTLDAYITTGDVTFKECSADGSGGAVYARLSTLDMFALARATFTTTAKGTGYALYLSIPNSAIPIVPPSFYSSLQAFGWTTGQCYIYHTSEFDILTWKEPTITVENRQSEDVENTYISTDTFNEDKKTAEIIYHAYQHLAYDGCVIQLSPENHYFEPAPITFARTVSIKGSGKDNTFQQIKPNLKYTYDTTDGQPLYTVSNYETTVTFEALTFETITLEDASLARFSIFLVQNGNLTFSDVIITDISAKSATKKNKIDPLDYSLIDASTGILVLDKCQFSSITMNEEPLLRINQQANSFSVNGKTTFSSIVRKKGNGAVIQMTIDDDDAALNLTNMLFESCKSKNGYGGAVALRLNAEVNITLGGKYGSLNFTKDTAFSTEESRSCSEEEYTQQDPVIPPDPPEDPPEEVEEEDDEEGTNFASGGGLYIHLSSRPFLNTFKVSNLYFTDCSAAFGTQFYGYSDDADLAYDTYLWRNLLNRDSADNEFLFATESSVNPQLPPSAFSRQAKDVLHYGETDDDGPSYWWIAIVVVAVVVVIIIVIIILCCVCKKSSANGDAGNTSSPPQPQEPPPPEGTDATDNDGQDGEMQQI